jgi:hypothetical protein
LFFFLPLGLFPRIYLHVLASTQIFGIFDFDFSIISIYCPQLTQELLMSETEGHHSLDADVRGPANKQHSQKLHKNSHY